MGTFYDAVMKIRKNGKQMKPSKAVDIKTIENVVKPIETAKNKEKSKPTEPTVKEPVKSTEVKKNDNRTDRKS